MYCQYSLTHLLDLVAMCVPVSETMLVICLLFMFNLYLVQRCSISRYVYRTQYSELGPWQWWKSCTSGEGCSGHVNIRVSAT